MLYNYLLRPQIGVIFAPAAFLRSGSRVSGYLSGIKLLPSVTRGGRHEERPSEQTVIKRTRLTVPSYGSLKLSSPFRRISSCVEVVQRQPRSQLLGRPADIGEILLSPIFGECLVLATAFPSLSLLE